jgi:hypothetical protein
MAIKSDQPFRKIVCIVSDDVFGVDGFQVVGG